MQLNIQLFALFLLHFFPFIAQFIASLVESKGQNTISKNLVHFHHHCQFSLGGIIPNLTLLTLYDTEPAALRALNHFIMDETKSKPDYTEAEIEELRALRMQAEEEKNNPRALAHLVSWDVEHNRPIVGGMITHPVYGRSGQKRRVDDNRTSCRGLHLAELEPGSGLPKSSGDHPSSCGQGLCCGCRAREGTGIIPLSASTRLLIRLSLSAIRSCHKVNF